MAAPRPLICRLREAAERYMRGLDPRAKRRKARSDRQGGEALLRNALSGLDHSAILEALSRDGVDQDCAASLASRLMAFLDPASSSEQRYLAIKCFVARAPEAVRQAEARRASAPPDPASPSNPPRQGCLPFRRDLDG